MGKVLISNNEMKAGPGIGSAFLVCSQRLVECVEVCREIDKQHKVDNKS
jgi:hypothetical protein